MANKKKKCCECIVNNNKKSAQITIHLISCHIELRRWKVMNHRVTWNAELFECVSTEWMSMSNNAIQFSEYEKEWGKMLIFDKSVSCYNVYVIAVSLSNDVLSVQVISNSFSFAFFYFIIVRCCWLCCPRFGVSFHYGLIRNCVSLFLGHISLSVIKLSRVNWWKEIG